MRHPALSTSRGRGFSAARCLDTTEAGPDDGPVMGQGPTFHEQHVVSNQRGETVLEAQVKRMIRREPRV